jgi:hypothetical protein
MSDVQKLLDSNYNQAFKKRKWKTSLITL